MFSQLLSIYAAVFKNKIRKAKRLEHKDLIIINVLDMAKTSIFYSSVYDVALFTVHELLHHDLTIEQSSMAKVSYMFSMIVFLLTCFELVNACHSLYNFRVGKLLKAIKLSDKIDTTMKNEAEVLKSRWKMIKAKDKYQKEYSYIFGMSKMYFLGGIDLIKTKTFLLRSVKLLSLFKTILFSLLINTL
jgi:BarA-like signal transduction histidine kinase